MKHETEAFWSGTFGTDYTERNRVSPDDRLGFWEDIIVCTMPKTVLEVGCNAGHNLLAIHKIAPDTFLHGCDINESALDKAVASGLQVAKLSATQVGQVYSGYELVFSAGVLIHIPPSHLDQVVDGMISASSKFVMAIEYAADQETEIDYRGHKGRLWKRPYGEILERKGLKIVDWGDAGPGFDRCHYWVGEKV